MDYSFLALGSVTPFETWYGTFMPSVLYYCDLFSSSFKTDYLWSTILFDTPHQYYFYFVISKLPLASLKGLQKITNSSTHITLTCPCPSSLTFFCFPFNSNTESPRLTRMTGPGKNCVRRNRALRGYCYLVSVLISLQNVLRLRNQS